MDEYFRYISSDADNAQEDLDFALLSPSLRAHFIFSHCSDTLREMRLINGITSDQVQFAESFQFLGVYVCEQLWFVCMS